MVFGSGTQGLSSHPLAGNAHDGDSGDGSTQDSRRCFRLEGFDSMRATKTELKSHVLRSASASMIVHVYVNHVYQEVVIHDGICQGPGGAPDGGATPRARSYTQVRSLPTAWI